VAVRIDANHCQRGYFDHRLGRGQPHAILQHPCRQLAAEAVARKGVQIQGFNTLSGKRPAEVVDRAANAGFKAAVSASDQINQRFTGRGHLYLTIFSHHIRVFHN
jgi:hypothetical protein